MKRPAAAGAMVAVLACAAPAAAQTSPEVQATPATMTLGSWAIAPVLEVRARGEYRHDLDDQDRGLVVERARLGADAVGGPVEARVVFQDAHAVDLTPGTEIVSGPSPTAVTGVYEAWGDVHSTGLRPSFLRIGRQAVTWGEGRLLGTADWTATGRSLDAVRGSVTFGDGSAEVLAAILTDNPTGASLAAYGELFGARFGWAFDPLFKAEAFAFARVVQSEPVETLDMSVRGETYTGSVRLYGDSFAWTWGAEGAFQLGHAADLSLDRQAWAAAGHVARVFDRVVFTPALQLGAAYASGDHGGSTYGTFDPLLPDVHVWHGAMDLFAWSNEGEGNARVSATPFYEGAVAVEYRYARLAQADGPWRTSYLTTIGSAPGNHDGNLGHEIDARVAWSPFATVDLEVGYSVLLLGGGAQAVLEAQGLARVQASGASVALAVSHFAYAQATVRLF